MAKYSNTKAKINEKITTNSAQAITGNILNDVLQTMVDSLGADYQFGGLVQPGSTFTAGEQPVVFLATTPGTYTNFGGLVVADGEVALLVWSGTAWSKQTPDIATRTEVSQLGQEVGQFIEMKTYTTSDGFVNAEGSMVSSPGFVHSSQIQLNPGQKIYIKARGYEDAVAMISILNSDSTYTPVSVSIDSTIHIYSYVNSSKNAKNIVCSFASNTGSQIWTSNVMDAAMYPDIVTEEEIQGIYKDLGDFSKSVVSITPAETGKFISYEGAVLSSSGFAYSIPILVKKGQAIVLYARGYSDAVAMISKVITEGSAYNVKVVSFDSVAHTYYYVSPEDALYAFSYATNVTPILNIVDSAYFLDEIDKIRLLSILNCDKSSKKVVGYSLTDDKFISNEGAVLSSNGFAYSSGISVRKGETIVVIARGYLDSVSIISKVITNNVSYTPVSISIDSNTHQYFFTSKEDAYYAVSFAKNTGADIYIVSGLAGTETESVEQMLFAGIPKIGIIGDSLASGAGYNPNTGIPSDNINYAWWQVFKRDGGNDYVRLCAGGMSARSFARNSHSSGIGLNTALDPDNKCQLYIIGLEVNDRSGIYPTEPTYLGSPSDIDLSDPENNADTFYGDYAYIIQKITAEFQDAKFIIFTNPRTDGDFNNAIRYISTIFSNCYLCDLWEMYSDLYTSGGYYDRFKDQSAHYPAMAYQSMGKLLEVAVSKVINNNLSAFKDIQYD